MLIYLLHILKMNIIFGATLIEFKIINRINLGEMNSYTINKEKINI